MWPSKWTWGEEVNHRNLSAQDCYSFGKLLCPQTEFLIFHFSSTCQLQAKRLHFPITGKEWWSTLLKMNFQFLACVQLPPAFRKAGCFFFSFDGGWGQGTAEHRLEAVFKCSSEHAVSHALLAGQKDALSRLSPIIPLHNISMHILYTVLQTFPKRLIRRICLKVKNCFSWWSSPQLSRLLCLIQGLYSEEKLDASYSYGLKG